VTGLLPTILTALLTPPTPPRIFAPVESRCECPGPLVFCRAGLYDPSPEPADVDFYTRLQPPGTSFLIDDPGRNQLASSPREGIQSNFPLLRGNDSAADTLRSLFAPVTARKNRSAYLKVHLPQSPDTTGFCLLLAFPELSDATNTPDP